MSFPSQKAGSSQEQLCPLSLFGSLAFPVQRFETLTEEELFEPPASRNTQQSVYYSTEEKSFCYLCLKKSISFQSLLNQSIINLSCPCDTENDEQVFRKLRSSEEFLNPTLVLP